MTKVLFKNTVLALLGLIVLASLLWGLSRALYPTAEQRETVAFMNDPGQPQGRNAFGLLWTIDRAVPESEIPQVIETDRQRMEQWTEDFGWADEQRPEFSSAALDYPDLRPNNDDGFSFCTSESGDCLDRVRKNPQAYRQLVENHRELLDRVARLGQHDYYRNRMPWNLATPMPAFGPAFHLLTRHAVMFVDGQLDEAISASCAQLQGWRRLSSDADSLIVQLVGQALVQQHGRMLVDMASEMPLHYSLPAACDSALQLPQAPEVSLCTAMRGEFALVNSVEIDSSHVPSSWLAGLGRVAFHLGYERDAMRAETATDYARLCSDQEIADNIADVRATTDPQPRGMVRLACAGNWIGCMLNEIATPAWSQYRLRGRDHGARLRLLNAWFDARTEAEGSAQRMTELLGRRLAELSHADRRYELDRQAGEIRVELYENSQDTHWRLPLPMVISMHDAASAGEIAKK